jgi:hypothetical protein
MATALSVLTNINLFLALANELVPGAIALGQELIADIKGRGENIAGFAEEEAKFSAAISGGLAADAAWRAQHGITLTEDSQHQSLPDPVSSPADNRHTGE